MYIGSLLRVLFSYKSTLLPNPKFGLGKSPENAPDDKSWFRLLQKATQGAALRTRNFLKKIE